MKGSRGSSLDQALEGGLKSIESLTEDARSADETITKYLRTKTGELLASRRAASAEDGDASIRWASEVLDQVVLDAATMYGLFEKHLKNDLGEFWEGLDLEGKPKEGAERKPLDESTKGMVPYAYSTGTQQRPLRERQFRCAEGCAIEGDVAYLAHRDRGHHPIPV